MAPKPSGKVGQPIREVFTCLLTGAKASALVDQRHHHSDVVHDTQVFTSACAEPSALDDSRQPLLTSATTTVMSSILPPRGRSRCHGGSSPARAAVATHGVRESLSFTCFGNRDKRLPVGTGQAYVDLQQQHHLDTCSTIGKLSSITEAGRTKGRHPAAGCKACRGRRSHLGDGSICKRGRHNLSHPLVRLALQHGNTQNSWESATGCH